MNKSNFEFKMCHSFDRRRSTSSKILTQFPDSCPVIIEKSTTSQLKNMEQTKFILRKYLTLAQLIHTIRSKIGITEKDSIFIIVGTNVTPQINKTIDELYEKYADNDGFLYITYCSENCFGSTQK